MILNSQIHNNTLKNSQVGRQMFEETPFLSRERKRRVNRRVSGASFPNRVFWPAKLNQAPRENCRANRTLSLTWLFVQDNGRWTKGQKAGERERKRENVVLFAWYRSCDPALISDKRSFITQIPVVTFMCLFTSKLYAII